jgi:hypothetical protein
MHPGHGVVQDDRLDGLGGEDFQAGVAIDCGDDVVAGAFEQNLPHPQADDFIVNA